MDDIAGKMLIPSAFKGRYAQEVQNEKSKIFFEKACDFSAFLRLICERTFMGYNVRLL